MNLVVILPANSLNSRQALKTAGTVLQRMIGLSSVQRFGGFDGEGAFHAAAEEVAAVGVDAVDVAGPLQTAKAGTHADPAFPEGILTSPPARPAAREVQTSDTMRQKPPAKAKIPRLGSAAAASACSSNPPSFVYLEPSLSGSMRRPSYFFQFFISSGREPETRKALTQSFRPPRFRRHNCPGFSQNR